MLDDKQSALVALACIGLVDAISYMVVAPSLIFYVQQVGGTKEQYGYILSAFSAASFCAKPLLGTWTDISGNKFRVPYLTSVVFACLGGFLYFYASAYKENTQVAVGLILAGRILGGFGAANAALGFAYLASVIPPGEQTKTNSLLSMTRIIGMAAGPGFNVLLKDINTTINIGGETIQIDFLNSVGLFLVTSNLIAMLCIFFLLKEPGPRLKTGLSTVSECSGDGECVGSRWDFIKQFFAVEIVLPVFTIFVVNSNFQLIETGFAPAAFHALNWGPVETSAVLGSTSIVLFLCMLVVFFLSSKKVKDEVLVMIGSCFWVVGGLLVYFLWVADTAGWHFVVSVIVCVSGFPFIAASNRSLFTRRVDANPYLETRHGFMQALLSMFASVAGIITPGFVAAYVLRDPEEVEASQFHRELNPLALYMVVGPLLTIVGVTYVSIFKPLKAEPFADDSDEEPNETTGLVDNPANRRRSSAMVIKQKLNPHTEVNRRMSAQCMGVPQYDTAVERKRQSAVYAIAGLANELADEF